LEKRFLSQSLTTEQAVKLLEQNGANVTPKGRKKTFVHKFFSQFADLMIVILLIAAALSFFVAIRSGQQSELVEPIVIMVIVVSNALLGAFQEYRAGFCPAEALKRGTLFPELVSEYVGGGC